MDNVSVIIRCRNEENLIGYAIQSVLDNLNTPEIIVLNNDSTDASMKIVSLFKADPYLETSYQNYTDINIINISYNDYTPGKALNIGVQQSTKDYILVLSSHCTLIDINLNEHTLALDTHCVVSGKQIPIYKGKKIIPRYIWKNFIDISTVDLYTEAENRYFLHNALAIYKKDILIEHPFDELLSTREDRYWVNNQIKNGNHSYYDPTLICYHHYTSDGATWKGIG